jgi:hypothetical protein
MNINIRIATEDDFPSIFLLIKELAAFEKATSKKVDIRDAKRKTVDLIPFDGTGQTSSLIVSWLIWLGFVQKK